MILYGRNLSPFARRVAIWCHHQGHEIERRELTVAGDDFTEIGRHNPVARVPILILDDGTHLIESAAICDYLEEIAEPSKRLIPASGPARVECMQRIALAQSTAEKVVAMVYEKVRRPEEFQWQQWQDRLMGQIAGGMAALDAAVTDHAEPDGGDVMMAITAQFAAVTYPPTLAPGYPRLKVLSDRAMDWAGFAETMPKA